jgi:hypothetical protein
MVAPREDEIDMTKEEVAKLSDKRIADIIKK